MSRCIDMIPPPGPLLFLVCGHSLCLDSVVKLRIEVAVCSLNASRFLPWRDILGFLFRCWLIFNSTKPQRYTIPAWTGPRADTCTLIPRKSPTPSLFQIRFSGAAPARVSAQRFVTGPVLQHRKLEPHLPVLSCAFRVDPYVLMLSNYWFWRIIAYAERLCLILKQL